MIKTPTSQTAIDLSQILPQYAGKWVAINEKNVVVASATNFAQIIKKSKQFINVRLIPAAKNYSNFVG